MTKIFLGGNDHGTIILSLPQPCRGDQAVCQSQVSLVRGKLKISQEGLEARIPLELVVSKDGYRTCTLGAF
eukprot:CAMPEP_0116151272 /NCGR_PEP_ID=MMETSP0329-20121206/20004_1 /TAXON_ID=697910 /ORGANISM="Pseudo-nitzschia arenysensis, Strain B593" /LENGTH=70 /DNA_ID=CAMNT_0003647865 /DNA_START=209 /DNA_END=421 /DNA_ORIENTATION=-